MFKKIFARAAVLAALLISLSSAALASFTDDGAITYKTPVGVMHGAGILGGYSDGSFDPKGSISREESAKMIAFSVLGEKAASGLSQGSAVFSDVSEGRWSAPYITWAVENDIISGLGDGSFNPMGKVTGYQIAKMMLCAAGYGQNGEYSGSSWELRTAADAFAKGIFTGIVNADPSRAVTREEAALYIFNGITLIEQVSFNPQDGKYLPADGSEAHDNTIAAEIHGIVDYAGKSTVFRGILTENTVTGSENSVVGEQSFPYTTGQELLGRAVAVYTNGGKGEDCRIYYIAEESETIYLEKNITYEKLFNETFGEDLVFPEKILIFSEEGLLTEETSIKDFNPSRFFAPAGSYVFFEGKLISYLPPLYD